MLCKSSTLYIGYSYYVHKVNVLLEYNDCSITVEHCNLSVECPNAKCQHNYYIQIIILGLPPLLKTREFTYEVIILNS